MKKIMSFYRRHIADVNFAVILVVLACLFYWYAMESITLGIMGALLLIVLIYMRVSIGRIDKPMGPFLIPLGTTKAENNYDPLPEPADKLPYVYYDKPVRQEVHTIHYYSPYLGMEQDVLFRPRKRRGKAFDNVRGIQVSDRLVLLRSILFTSNFPGDIREMAKQYEGRLPNEAEIKQIYAKFKEINQNLYECGEPLLEKRKYLYTSGDEGTDKMMNYCLNFASGQESLVDCDSFACAVLVERLPLDAKKLKADLRAIKTEHSESELDDEFDVLCEIKGRKVRLPFSQRNSGQVIGIFPFKDEPEYIELDEVEHKKHTDKDVDESRLLDERFCCGCVSLVVDRLNLYLKEMNKPILEGSYLADSSYMQGCGWILGFDNTSDYYGGNLPAKLRYMGRFYGTCRNRV